jgi:hypothetical protein
MINRNVAAAINGLVEFLRLERKHVPGEILWEADRLECLLFSGYDPDFEGDEPPGLLEIARCFPESPLFRGTPFPDTR